jgi:hypothetical protein
MEDEKPTTTFPEREIKLLSGKYVTIRPWSLSLGRRMRKRIVKMFTEAQEVRKSEEEVDVAAIFDHFEDEIIEVIRETLGVESEWMDENLRYEELFVLAQAIFEVCLFRSDDKGGLMGKVLGMASQMGLTEHVALPEEVLTRLELAKLQWAAAGSQKTSESGTSGSPEDSPSSADAATETQSTSGTT